MLSQGNAFSSSILREKSTDMLSDVSKVFISSDNIVLMLLLSVSVH